MQQLSMLQQVCSPPCRGSGFRPRSYSSAMMLPVATQLQCRTSPAQQWRSLCVPNPHLSAPPSRQPHARRCRVVASSKSHSASSAEPLELKEEVLEPFQSQLRKLEQLQEALEKEGIVVEGQLRIAQYGGLCPFCEGGRLGEKSFTMKVEITCDHAIYNCFRATCGMSGAVWVPDRQYKRRPPMPDISAPESQLDEATTVFFQRRGISRNTLDTCKVYSMQAELPQPSTSSSGRPRKSRQEADQQQQQQEGVQQAQGGQQGAGEVAPVMRHCAAIPYFMGESTEMVNMTFMDLWALDHLEQVESEWTGRESLLKPGKMAAEIHIGLEACTLDSRGDQPLSTEELKKSRLAPTRAPLDISFTNVREARASAVWQMPGRPRVLWGLTDVTNPLGQADSIVEPDSAGGGRTMYIVEDELDRMSLIEAGFGANQVLSLPPGTRANWSKQHQQSFKARTSSSSAIYPSHLFPNTPGNDPFPSEAGTRRTKRKAAASDLEEILGDDIMSLIFDDCSKIVLALHNVKDTAGLEGADKGSMAHKALVKSLQASDRGLPEAIASRIGKDRCWKVDWPSIPQELPASSPFSCLHDAADAPPAVLYGRVLRRTANDMLLADGPEALEEHLLGATEWPVEGLFTMGNFMEEILHQFGGHSAFGSGVSTGWKGMDVYYKPVPGELTVVTGVPNSGKSEWLDALCMNLSAHHGWKVAMASFEKSPRDHARQLLEKYAGLSFVGHLNGRDIARMSPQDVQDGLAYINEHFFIIRNDAVNITFLDEAAATGATPMPFMPVSPASLYKSPRTGPSVLWGDNPIGPYLRGGVGYEGQAGRQRDDTPTIDWVLEKARAAVHRYSINGLVIDPYNELDHYRPTEMSETEYVSSMLSKLKRFAQEFKVHVWLVAHPKQLKDWAGSPPTMYDIAGSAHFINKADAGIVVHRFAPDLQQALGLHPRGTVIIVEKMRNRAAGTKGAHMLLYNRENGIYCDPEDEEVQRFQGAWANRGKRRGGQRERKTLHK